MSAQHTMTRRAAALATTLLVASVAQSATLAAEAPPKPGTPRDFALPAKQTVTLDNGLKVTFVEYGNVPKVVISAIVRTGNVDEGGRTWLADLTGQMMEEGAGERSAAEIARDAAAMGGSLGVSVGADQLSVGLSVLSEHAAGATGIVADVLQRPTLPASEIERLKANLQRSLAVALTQPGTLAEQAFLKLLYGDHAYGVTLPTAEQLASYRIEDVRAFHAAFVGAGRTHLYVAGRFDRAALERAIRDQFGGWARGAPVQPVTPPLANVLRVKFIDRPDAPQSTIRLGLRVPDATYADFQALLTMNTLLGGASTSRITMNVRDRNGYAYSPYSAILPQYRAGHWVNDMDVTTAETAAALREVFSEVRRLQQSPPPPAAELDGIKNYRTGLFVVRNATPAGVLGQLAFLDLHGLPDEYLTKFVANAYAVTADQVTEAARSWLPLDRMTLVIVGDLKQVEASVRALPELKNARFD